MKEFPVKRLSRRLASISAATAAVVLPAAQAFERNTTPVYVRRMDHIPTHPNA
jgi:hypothetical protein